MQRYDTIVIGAGHNGLACACYLARSGQRVLVVEMANRIGGAVHTAATIEALPNFRFDTCSVVHNMINMTTVLDELRLADVGLRYIETDPFVTSCFPDGTYVRCYRSVERTCTEIARFSARDADAYERFIRAADPLIEAALMAFSSSGDLGKSWRERRYRLGAAVRAVRQWGPRDLVATLLQPYGALLQQTFATDHASAGLAALAAHGTLGPQTPGTALFVLWQAAYHRYGNWHAQGGSGALALALRRRLEMWGGEIQTGTAVDKILVQGRVRGVRLVDGSQIAAPRVVAAINPQTALVDLLDEHLLPGTIRARLQARQRSNAVQFVVHAALRQLPPWPEAPDGIWNGMQSVARSVGHVRQNFVEAEAGYAPTDPAAYVFTPSAIDDTLAPPTQHGAYIACPSYPARFADGSMWRANGEREAHRLLDAVEKRAPGFKDTIRGLSWRHADDWEQETGLLGGHSMHIDMTLDQLGMLRPVAGLAHHRTPVPGLYVSGAGTAPTGGVSAVPGRAAARAVLDDGWTR